MNKTAKQFLAVILAVLMVITSGNVFPVAMAEGPNGTQAQNEIPASDSETGQKAGAVTFKYDPEIKVEFTFKTPDDSEPEKDGTTFSFPTLNAGDEIEYYANADGYMTATGKVVLSEEAQDIDLSLEPVIGVYLETDKIDAVYGDADINLAEYVKTAEGYDGTLVYKVKAGTENVSLNGTTMKILHPGTAAIEITAEKTGNFGAVQAEMQVNIAKKKVEMDIRDMEFEHRGFPYSGDNTFTTEGTLAGDWVVDSHIIDFTATFTTDSPKIGLRMADTDIDFHESEYYDVVIPDPYQIECRIAIMYIPVTVNAKDITVSYGSEEWEALCRGELPGEIGDHIQGDIPEERMEDWNDLDLGKYMDVKVEAKEYQVGTYENTVSVNIFEGHPGTGAGVFQLSEGEKASVIVTAEQTESDKQLWEQVVFDKEKSRGTYQSDNGTIYVAPDGEAVFGVQENSTYDSVAISTGDEYSSSIKGSAKSGKVTGSFYLYKDGADGFRTDASEDEGLQDNNIPSGTVRYDADGPKAKFSNGSSNKLTEETVGDIEYSQFANKEGKSFTVTISDSGSGLKEAGYTILNVAPGSDEKIRELADSAGYKAIQNGQTVEISGRKDGRYVIVVRAEDMVGNVAYTVSDGIIVDTKEPAVTVSGLKQGAYYNADVNYTLTVQDEADAASGIRALSVTVKADGKEAEGSFTLTEADINKIAGISEPYTAEALEKMGKPITYEASIPAELNSDDIEITIKAVDRAGNTNTMVRRIKIDTDNPDITAKYDNNNAKNDTYFNKERTLTATVKDRAFDTEDVVFTIGTNGKQAEYSYQQILDGAVAGVEAEEAVTEKDGTVYVLTFGRDEKTDRDYTVNISLTDKAGNKSEAVFEKGTRASHAFTVDKIAPETSIRFRTGGRTISPASEESGRTYSRESINGRLTVSERNFSPSLAKLTLEQKNFKGEDVSAYARENVDLIQKEKGWTSGGEEHIYDFIEFENDANYTVGIAVEDLAGNQAVLPEYRFTVDKTPPEGRILVEHGSSSNIFETLVEKARFLIFSNTNILVGQKAADVTSGVESVSYWIYTPDKNTHGEFSLPAVEELRNADWSEWGSTLTLRPDRQAVVYERIIDKAGNTTYINTSEGIIADATKPAEPILTITADRPDSQVFNTDVPFTINVTDPVSGGTYAGLKSVSYEITSGGKVTQSGSYDTDLDDPAARVQSFERKVVVDAGLNNSNDVVLTVTASDYAGNAVSASKRIAIDTTAPSISVSYDRNDPANGRYFRNARTATVNINERNFNENRMTVSLSIDGKTSSYSFNDLTSGRADGVSATRGNDSEAGKGMSSLTDGRTVTYFLTFGANGRTDHDYSIDITVTDEAGNRDNGVEFGASNPGNSFTIDEIAPSVSMNLFRNGNAFAAGNNEQGRTYSNNEITASVTVNERNFTASGFSAPGTGTDAGGKQVWGQNVQATWSGSGNTHTGTLPVFSGDANYIMNASVTDLAGNTVSIAPVYFTVDRTAPSGSITVRAGGEEGSYSSFVQKLRFWFFSNSGASVERQASDATSGVADISYWIYVPDKDAKNTFDGPSLAALAGADWKQWNGALQFSPDRQAVIYQRVTDKAGNVTYVNTKDGIILDATSPVAPVISINAAEPRKGIYNGDVPFTISVTDPVSGGTYAGLRSVSYEVLNGSERTQSGNYNGAFATREGRVQSFSRSETIDAEKNNSNNVRIRVTATDYAGNTVTAEKSLKIDITAPRIEITYDRNDGAKGRYYNTSRTATVRVYERNFDPADFDLSIRSALGHNANIGSWRLAGNMGESDNAVSTLTVVFDAEDDYTVTASMQDMAGNRTALGRTDSFTIDKTRPELSVTYDNNSVKNEKYYNKARTATITVTDRNFDKEAFTEKVTAELDGAVIEAPKMSGWTDSGDRHTATIVFNKDGSFTLTASAADLAGNTSTKYDSGSFVIDMTAPEVKIEGIEDLHAYNGAIHPVVSFSDINAGNFPAKVTLRGGHHKETAMKGKLTEAVHGGSIALEDIKDSRTEDDVYTMKAVFADLAGNETVKEITFSVNRYGSNFTFDEATAALLARLYVNKGQDVVVLETNVDPLESRTITLGVNGVIKNLEEGRDYTVEESGEEGWKVYRYTIYARNFTAEGMYDIVISSTDAAGNTQDNKLKDAPIIFAVDSTSPSVVITGLTNGERYNDTYRDFAVNVTDNLAAADVQVYLTNEEAPGADWYRNKKPFAEFTAEEVEKAGGKMALRINEDNNYQTLVAVAKDAAGNEAISDSVRVLVTTNPWMRFYRNTNLFTGTIGTLGGGGCLLLFLLWKKRKKDEEEKAAGKTPTDDLDTRPEGKDPTDDIDPRPDGSGETEDITR